MKPAVLIVGLGRFGTAAALELMALGHEVLALDHDEAVVDQIAPEVTHAAQLDATDEGALRSVGAGDFEFAIVAISSVTDASIFATMALKNLGVQQVIAKAATKLHGAILERVGADRVIYAEQEMGNDAHRMSHATPTTGRDTSHEAIGPRRRSRTVRDGRRARAHGPRPRGPRARPRRGGGQRHRPRGHPRRSARRDRRRRAEVRRRRRLRVRDRRDQQRDRRQHLRDDGAQEPGRLAGHRQGRHEAARRDPRAHRRGPGDLRGDRRWGSASRIR